MKSVTLSLLPHPFVPQWLCARESIMQNKPNVKMGKMTISIATLKTYANKQRAMNNERYSKQTQTKPISVSAARFIVYKWRTVPEGPMHRFAARELRIERRDTKYEIREYDWWSLSEVYQSRLRGRV